jgi:murein L,D-transpeptidase YcbB/YkuD
MRAHILPALSLAACLSLAGCHHEKAQEKALAPEAASQVSQKIRATVETPTLPVSIRDQKERARAWSELTQFYRKRGFQPAWSDANGPRPQAEELLAAIDPMTQEGIDVRRYEKPRLAEQIHQAQEDHSLDSTEAQQRMADLDVELTFTYLTLAAHEAIGRVQPDTIRTDWYTKPRNVDLDTRLSKALETKGGIAESLRSLAPPQEDYARLRQALASYQEIASRGGWPLVPAGPALTKGASGDRVRLLRQRLAATGDLAATPQGAPAVYDDAVVAAVAHFQNRHGLEPSGKVDADTLAEMNVPVGDRIRQIALNMERWRWLPSDLGQRYIYVNVPEYRLDLVEAGHTALTMRVVVGKLQSKTPVFSDEMTYLELNPAWNLPNDIVANEIAPKASPGYLASKNLELVRGWNDTDPVDPSSVDLSQLGKPGFPYRLRQKPGEDNPLGQIKFMFPNQFDVYLHDTPADHLFSATERDFSHGCVRLERPVQLAEYLLKDDPKWQGTALRDAITSGEHETVTLKNPLPVHILYFTAFVEKDGTVQFRRDVYGHDATLAEALAKEPIVPLDVPALRGEGQRAGDIRRKG